MHLEIPQNHFDHHQYSAGESEVRSVGFLNVFPFFGECFVMATSLIRSFMPRPLLVAAGLAVFAAGAQPLLAGDAAQEKDKDVKAIKKFADMFKKTWESGPTRLTNKAIEKAYPGYRFYYVFSSRAARKADKSKTAQVFQLTEEGQASFLSQDRGLMKIRDVNDAKVAAAAVMSLSLGFDVPIAVDANDVQASHNQQGWRCKANKKECFWDVVFDRDGHLHSASCLSPDHSQQAMSKPNAAAKAQKMFYSLEKLSSGATVVVLHNTPKGDVRCGEIPADKMMKDGTVVSRPAAGSAAWIFCRKGKITAVKWERQSIPAAPDAAPKDKDKSAPKK
jgi:hypothetical protein